MEKNILVYIVYLWICWDISRLYFTKSRDEWLGEYGLLGSLWIDEDPTTTFIVWVDYDPNSFSWPNEPGSPNKPTINGITNGKIENEYKYIFNAIDPENDDLKYHIDWGDDNSEITNFENSSIDIKVKYIWTEKGTYIIKAKAEDINGKYSSYGTLTVTMPKNKPYINRSILNLLQQHPNLFPILRQLLQKL